MKVDRSELCDEIAGRDSYDLIVVGGGIHGAAFAHLAALNGISVLLLEKHDYASGTSSRSSKMAHGGLRYLEMFGEGRSVLLMNAGCCLVPWFLATEI